MSTNMLCTVIVVAFVIVIISAIIKARKGKKELKEMDERLKL